MQIFNYFNCRKVNENGLNLLKGMRLSHVLIVVSAFLLQVLVVSLGDSAWGFYPGGLTFFQWILCIGFALCSIVTGIMIKKMPLDDDS